MNGSLFWILLKSWDSWAVQGNPVTVLYCNNVPTNTYIGDQEVLSQHLTLSVCRKDIVTVSLCSSWKDVNGKSRNTYSASLSNATVPLLCQSYHFGKYPFPDTVCAAHVAVSLWKSSSTQIVKLNWLQSFEILLKVTAQPYFCLSAYLSMYVLYNS